MTSLLMSLATSGPVLGHEVEVVLFSETQGDGVSSLPSVVSKPLFLLLSAPE